MRKSLTMCAGYWLINFSRNKKWFDFLEGDIHFRPLNSHKFQNVYEYFRRNQLIKSVCQQRVRINISEKNKKKLNKTSQFELQALRKTNFERSHITWNLMEINCLHSNFLIMDVPCTKTWGVPIVMNHVYLKIFYIVRQLHPLVHMYANDRKTIVL